MPGRLLKNSLLLFTKYFKKGMTRIIKTLIFSFALFSSISGQIEQLQKSKITFPRIDFMMDTAGIDSIMLNKIMKKEKLSTSKLDQNVQFVLNHRLNADTLILLTKEYFDFAPHGLSVVFRTFSKNLKLNKYFLNKKKVLIVGYPNYGIIPTNNYFVDIFHNQTKCPKKNIKHFPYKNIQYEIVNSQTIEIRMDVDEKRNNNQYLKSPELKTKSIIRNINSFLNSSFGSIEFCYSNFYYCNDEQ